MDLTVRRVRVHVPGEAGAEIRCHGWLFGSQTNTGSLPKVPGGVAYQQHSHVALTLAGPFGARQHHAATAKGFLEYCAQHALTPCLYSCTDELWPMLQSRGFRRVPVAQETRLRIRGGLEFKGKEWQNVRTSLNRAAKMGITARWGRYSELPHGVRAK